METSRAIGCGLLLALATACGSSPSQPPPAPPTCNGHAELCSRRYNEVAYPGTHDSYSDTDENFLAPDQTHPVAQQLADGIRVLHFEVLRYQGQVDVCHGACGLGHKTLLEEMQVVAAFVKDHPREVVSLLLERSDAAVTADDIGQAIVDAGLEPSMHTQLAGEPWPTLGEMISGGDRVVAFLDDTSGSSFAWLLPRWDWTWETPWDNETAQDFGRCDADRGTRGNSLYTVDTFLEDLAIPNVEHGKLVNYDPFLVDRLLYCKNAVSTLPNFALVNFYEASDLFHAVDVLNGFAPAPTVEGFPPESLDGGSPDGG